MNGGLSLRRIDSMLSICKGLDFEFWKNWNEDIVFSIFSKNIPDKKQALSFSIECYPEKCVKENNNRLPFGCHAWYKCGGGNTGLYNDLFWLKKIAPLIYVRKKIRRWLFSKKQQ